ncbi:helix-turn-helix transcriptional regulator [Shimazuella alba]|uniref:Helix-turn-helix domain-containing protein n=1 Tax=Shimazuella alba TaxID=2690964 RepID=A0A6I4VRL2_9BACL|nr:AraC family transcriptional regulator [Shimazuella alba]MXQ52905.1 helix-turn-helix domain-containing protein [Shimazuella alba]
MKLYRYEKELEGVVSYIQYHLDRPLSLSEIANYAGYSPYHFTRIFKEKIGVSPFYYISSLRMQQAKKMLLDTNFPVRDIGLNIGQQSLGTFTTQFTKRVGMTPSAFRKSTQMVNEDFPSLKQMNQWSLSKLPNSIDNRIEGIVESEVPIEGVIFIGLFAKPVPEGLPLYGTLLSSEGSFCFKNVNPGMYYLMATSVSWEMESSDVLLPEKTLRFRSHQPIIVKDCFSVPFQQVTLRPPLLDDPPILVSLPLLMRIFLKDITAIDKKSR